MEYAYNKKLPIAENQWATAKRNNTDEEMKIWRKLNKE